MLDDSYVKVPLYVVTVSMICVVLLGEAYPSMTGYVKKRSNSMTNALSFRNIESDVTAIKLNSASTGEIGKLLGKEAALQMLATFSAIYSEAEACHNYSFRYKDETIDSKLVPGDYLVKLNTGKYVARTPESFESEFIYTDDDIVPIDAKTPLYSFTAMVTKKYVDLAIKDQEDCLARMNLVVEKLRDWYTTRANLITLDFSNYAMISPVDLHHIINPFGKATYMNGDTQITLNFNNVGPESRNVKDLDRSKINSFNLVGLQELIGELKLVDKEVRSKITSASFVGTLGAPSAVASSVTEGQWLDIIDELRNLTGISRNASVTR